MRARLAVPSILGLALALPAAADATVRHAAPGGATTGDCTSVPCAIVHASQTTTGADELVLASGTYAVPQNGSLQVQGLWRADPAAPRPVIQGSFDAGQQINLAVLNAGATVRHLAIQQDDTPASTMIGFGARIEDCFVSGINGVSLLSAPNVISGSVVVGRDRGISTNDDPAAGRHLVTGSTVVATGGATAAAVEVTTALHPTSAVELRNSIARSPTGTDVRLISTGSGNAIFRGRSSAFRAPVHVGNGFYDDGFATADVDANVGATPLLPGLATGDAHQAAGSPTIDRGDPALVEPGAPELDGQSRAMGARVDIGADEFAPPIVISDPPVNPPPPPVPPFDPPAPPVIDPPAAVDRTRPRLTKARLTRSRAGRVSLRATVSEAAVLRLRVVRSTSARQAIGRSVTRKVRPGAVRITLSAATAARLRGTRQLEIRATDPSGNRSATLLLHIPARRPAGAS